MIAANKRLLKANLTQGVLGIQTNLITLYTNNLSAVATQAALISGFAFQALYNKYDVQSTKDLILSYFFITCFTLSLITALFVLAQATLVVTFGPTMALKGTSDDAVKVAASNMRSQQIEIFYIASISITALFIGTCILSWSLFPTGLAVITTFLYIVGYYYILKRGFKAYLVFVPNADMDQSEMENYKNYSKSNEKGTEDNQMTGDGGTYSVVSIDDDRNSQSNPYQIIKLKFKAILWLRMPIEEGGLFVKYFAVLDKGKLDFYNKEKDYQEKANPINKKPIKLWQFDLETDPKKYVKNVSSFAASLKSAMIGNEDFSVSDLLSEKDDLNLASRYFKFGLIPKVSSELSASVHFELLASDERTYKSWIQSLGMVANAYDQIAAAPSIEQTLRTGNSDVEVVVQVANLSERV
eukprot:gene7670-10438_t